MSMRLGSDERAARRSAAGAGALVLGLGLVAVSLFMFFENVQISGGFLGSLGWGPRGFGWSLLPLLFGVAWIVWRPRGLGGWALALLGVVVIGLEVLGSLTFYFRPVSLITVLLMLVPGAVGAALVLKNL
ncbi:MAG TPA: hypothetical protein VII06_03965 [Chloroflexota bacterium]|jgi:hypothetical protein